MNKFLNSLKVDEKLLSWCYRSYQKNNDLSAKAGTCRVIIIRRCQNTIIKKLLPRIAAEPQAGNIQFASGSYNESNEMYKINLKCSHIHLASRGFKDSIGDIEYQQGNIRIGLRTNGIPANLFIELI